MHRLGERKQRLQLRTLKNPVNGAADMAAMLKKLGFTVTLKQNTKQQEGQYER
ncbi:MAG: hypothetical protein ABIJ44_07530 [Pseudomonadota bacterium]